MREQVPLEQIKSTNQLAPLNLSMPLEKDFEKAIKLAKEMNKPHKKSVQYVYTYLNVKFLMS
jgi:hypothetical protein